MAAAVSLPPQFARVCRTAVQVQRSSKECRRPRWLAQETLVAIDHLRVVCVVWPTVAAIVRNSKPQRGALEYLRIQPGLCEIRSVECRGCVRGRGREPGIGNVPQACDGQRLFL